MNPPSDKSRTPSARELAAYADGELDEEERAAVEDWLAAHPDAAAEVEAQQGLTSLFRSTQPAPPSTKEWEAVLSSIESGLVPSPAAAGRTFWVRPKLLAGAILVMASAAAVLLTLNVGLVPVEPFEVASAEDVDIISEDASEVDAAEAGTVVLGGAGNDALVLASAGDVVLESVQPDEDGTIPHMRIPHEGPDSPMIVVPLDAGAID